MLQVQVIDNHMELPNKYLGHSGICYDHPLQIASIIKVAAIIVVSIWVVIIDSRLVIIRYMLFTLYITAASITLWHVLVQDIIVCTI